jgi:hypothetical protein
VENSEAKRLAIRQAATGYEMWLSPEAASQRVIGRAIVDYVQQNKQPWLLQRRFDIEKRYTLPTANEEKAAFEA